MGGALGATCRYLAGRLTLVAGHPHFNTMLINLAGCFAIGVAWSVIEHWQLSVQWRLVMVAGFLGGFTTYSSFSLETVQLLQAGKVMESLLYALLTVAGCIAACAAGLWLAGRCVKLL